MENLKILSMNLGRSFIPIKDKSKRELITDFIRDEDYNIIMLQGNNLTSNISFNDFGYNAINYENKMAILYDSKLIGFSNVDKSKFANSTIIYDEGPIACINVNCSNPNNMSDVFEMCDAYSNPHRKHSVNTRIIAGRFPKELDTNEFCDLFDLEDISTLVGRDSHTENNRDMLNHVFISRNLEASNIRKLVGLTEVSKVGEAYPVEAVLSYKKVLK